MRVALQTCLALFAAFVSLTPLLTPVLSTPLPEPLTTTRTVHVENVATFLANIAALAQWDTINVSKVPLQTKKEQVQAVQLLETLSETCHTLIGVQELFHRAADSNAVDVIQQVLQINLELNNTLVNPSENGNYAIRWASVHGHTEVVRLLLHDRRVDPSEIDNEAIQWASRYGHTEVVRLLLKDSRVDPSANDNLAIRLASEYGHTELVRLLLHDTRVDPSTNDNNPIQGASECGHTDVIRLLLDDSRVDPSANDNLAMRQASWYGHTEVVRLLLQDTRVDPSAKDNYAIRGASENGHTEVVRLLLNDPRVDSSAKNKAAIRSALRNGHTEVVKLLREFARNRVSKLSVQKVFRDDNDTACIICSETESSKVFSPCGHMCSCDKCAKQIMNHDKRCPLCRASIEGILTLEQATASSS